MCSLVSVWPANTGSGPGWGTGTGALGCLMACTIVGSRTTATTRPALSQANPTPSMPSFFINGTAQSEHEHGQRQLGQGHPADSARNPVQRECDDDDADGNGGHPEQG